MEKQEIQNENLARNGNARLLYIQLPVEDIERSLAFYTELLGMRLLRRQDYPEAHVSLGFVGYENDAAMLGLRYQWGHVAPNWCAEFGPVALGVPEWEQIGARLETAGIKVKRPPVKTADGARIAFLHDPDGYEIELIEELEKPETLLAETAGEHAEIPRSAAVETLRKAQTTKHKNSARERILEAAGRGFRLRGYGGIGVDGLAKEAGVTSGAFYGHFRSKEEAFQAAVTAGIDDFRAGVEHFRAENGTDWVQVFARWYLGRAYIEDIAGSCALPSLSPDVVRSDDGVRRAYEAELKKLAEAVAAGLPAASVEQKAQDAWVFLALLAGGVTLARAVEDEELAKKIADSVRDAVIGLALSRP